MVRNGALSPRSVRLLLAIAWAAVVLPCLPVRELMPPDEPRFGEVAREMREGGTWVVPHLAGRVYGDKPPVLFWAVNLASFGKGDIRETTARIPSALAALAAMLLTARLARRLTGSAPVALASGLVLLTSSEFFQRAQWVSTDMLLCAFSLAAAVAWSEALFGAPCRWMAASEAGPVASPPPPGELTSVWAGSAPLSATALLTLGWLAATGAVLTKGPIGLFWALAWPVAEGFARGMRGPLRRLVHPAGFVLFVVLTGGWLVAAERLSGGGFIREVLLHQSVQRYLDSWNNQQPWHFYLHQFALDLAPWSLLFPAALVCLGRRAPERTRIAARAIVGFLAAGGLLLSFTSGKRGVYLLPAFPASALLLTVGFFEASARGSARRLLRNIPLVLADLLGALLATAGFVAILRPGAGALPFGWTKLLARGEFHSAGPLLLAAGVLLCLGASTALVLSLTERPGASLGALACALGAVWLIAGTGGGAMATRHQGAAAFGREVASRVPENATLAIERGKFELILFYSRRKGFQFQEPGELVRAAAAGQARFALVEEPTWRGLVEKGETAEWRTLWQGAMSTTDYRLIELPAR